MTLISLSWFAAKCSLAIARSDPKGRLERLIPIPVSM
jgi:hypothetical protein